MEKFSSVSSCRNDQSLRFYMSPVEYVRHVISFAYRN